jgi:hypothetical protein
MSPQVDRPLPPYSSLYKLVVSAVSIGIVSVLLFHKQISKSFQLFQEGLDRELFWTYCDGFKEKGWEICWRPAAIIVLKSHRALLHEDA